MNGNRLHGIQDNLATDKQKEYFAKFIEFLREVLDDKEMTTEETNQLGESFIEVLED